MRKKYLGPAEKKELLDKAIITGDFVLASGQRVAQKFDFDLIDTNTDLFRSIVTGLGACVRDNYQDFNGIVTIANGATRLGEPLSELLGVKHVATAYTIDGNGEKRFSVLPVKGANRVIAIDDVFTKGTNTTKVAKAARQHGIEVVGVSVVLDRSGLSMPTIMGGTAVASLVQYQLN